LAKFALEPAADLWSVCDQEIVVDKRDNASGLTSEIKKPEGIVKGMKDTLIEIICLLEEKVTADAYLINGWACLFMRRFIC
jgi:hypothetical protein